MKISIYHNPRCSKSRAALALLRGRGLEPEIIEYLQAPPDAATLRRLLKMLGMKPRELLRGSEEAYGKLGLDRDGLSDADIIAAMIACPALMERPIVVAGTRAVIGRPPERALEILNPV